MVEDPRVHGRWERYRLPGIVATIAMLALMALAIQTAGHGALVISVIAIVALSTAVFLRLFPGSRFFILAMVNSLALYVIAFTLLAQDHIERLNDFWALVGFCLPILALLAGAARQRREIRALLLSEELRIPTELPRAALLLVPLLLVLLSAFLVPGIDIDGAALDVIYLTHFAVAALIVFLMSRTVCVFMLDTGLVFEDFFQRSRRLFVPAFAFLTFYSIVVIVFACIYRIVDYYTPVFHFLVAGELRHITFQESLYFSIVTLSTVGYGDIVVQSDVMRVIVAVQIVIGVVLVLFGFSEIIGYAREHHVERRRTEEARHRAMQAHHAAEHERDARLRPDETAGD